MSIGELDSRLKLESPSIVRDPAFGSEQLTWPLVATVWAKVMERAASEAVQADQRVMTRQITIRIRWRSDVLTTWRCRLGNRLLRITGAIEVGRRQWLHLQCEEFSDA